jgi:hypothetical protein
MLLPVRFRGEPGFSEVNVNHFSIIALFDPARLRFGRL